MDEFMGFYGLVLMVIVISNGDVVSNIPPQRIRIMFLYVSDRHYRFEGQMGKVITKYLSNVGKAI